MSVASSKKTWTIKELMDWTIDYLSEKNFSSPRVNVEWLLCDTLSCKRMELYLNFDRPLAQSELDQFRSRLTRRLNKEPLQYIVGSADFMGLHFQVGPEVLIPRTDTELLVERTLSIAQTFPAEKELSVLDIGTGSGAIAIALAYYFQKAGRLFRMTALDISEPALACARNNAAKLIPERPVEFVHGDIFDDAWAHKASGQFDIIVSNPPYISEKEYLALDDEVCRFEPKTALWADDNGLAFYKRIGHISKMLFRPGGFLAVEIAYDQKSDVTSILQKDGFSDLKTSLDIQGHDRVITGFYHES